MKALSPTTYAAYALVLSAALLFCAGLIPSVNMGFILVFSTLLYQSTQYQSPWRIINIGLWLLTLVLGLFLASYRPTNFNYPLIWHFPALYEGGKSFDLYSNLSKALGGYLVVVYYFDYAKHSPSKPPLLYALIAAVAGVICILGIGITFFNIGWSPKVPSGIVFFVLVNLLTTVVAEEAFFRLLVQNRISRFFKNKTWGIWLSALASTVIFAFAHTTQLGPALALFLIAGAIYSLVYTYTQRFYLSIGVHFATNLLHFLLLEYPMPL